MKKNYFLLVVSILIGIVSFGQTVSIGTPGTTTNQAIPIEPFYGYSWGQCIYPANELTTAGIIGVRQIDTIMFEYTSATLNNSTDWVVYLGHTTKSTFSSGTDWEPLSNLTQVFNGTATVTVVSGGNNLVKIVLSSPFYWDGTSNLMVAVDENMAGYGSGSDDFYCRSVTGTRSIVYRNDGTNPDPASPPAATFQRSYVPNLRISHSAPPACLPPSGLTASGITATDATLGWTELGTATLWEYEYGATGFTLGTGTEDTTSMNPVTITGLSSLTNYEYYVRAKCGATDSSSWAGPFSFITACSSQLNGVYTLDPASAASATNFITMSDFMSFLANCGVSGPTVLNVDAASGPHIMGQDLAAYPGMSAANPVVINGNGTIVNHNGGNYFLALNGVKHFTINDFMFVNETPNTQKFGIMMRGGCDSINITNNTINLGTGFTSSASGCIVSSNLLTSATSGGNNADNITIDSNTLIGGYYGIRLNGTGSTNRNTGATITNNIFEDIYLYSIYTNNYDDVTIHNNDISRPNRTSITTFYGIRTNYSSEVVISNNKIHNTGNTSYTCYPIYFGYSKNTSANPSYIVNNAIYDMNTKGTFYGIYLYSYSATTGKNENINVWHNTITKNTDGGTGTTRGISTASTSANYIDSVDFSNNIIDIYGTGSGTKYSIYLPSIATFTGGNNDIHMGATAGNNTFAYFGSNQADLTAWTTASGLTGDIDNNPIIIAPDYTPYSNLIDNLGTPLALVPMDIDGATRSATPDMGAVEFVPSGGDLAILDGGLSRVSDCYGTMDTAWVDIKNLFGSTIDFTTDPLTVYFDVTGPINTSVTTVLNMDSLMVDSTITVMNTGIDMSVPGKYSITAYVNFALNNILAVNDSLVSIDEVDVKPLIAVTPTYDTLLSYTDSSKLSTQSPFFPGGAFLMTEICQYGNGGSTLPGTPVGGKPSYWGSTDDYIEITGVPGSDLAGITLELWSTTALRGSYTFPAGTILSPNGIALINTANTTSSPANFFYTSFALGNGSATASGRILKDASGNIMDAVGYSGSSSSGYTFPASAGVSPSDWSGSPAISNSTMGIRLEGSDDNTATNWKSCRTPELAIQDPGTLNTGVPLPAPTSVSGLTWTDLTTMSVIDTTPEIYAQGFTANGTYPIEATYVTPCGTYSDTAYITVLNTTYDTTVINSCDTFLMPINGMVQRATGFFTDTLMSTSAPIYDSIYYVYDVNIDTTNETITLVECDSFVSPSGKIWNVSGTYNDTIVNSLGCDSLMVFNLTVNYISYDTITTTVCDTFIAPSGQVLRATGTYYDTIPNASGCDSAMTINLTILNSTTITISPVVCDSFVSPNGLVWNTTGVYNDTIPNSIGCDSVLVYNLTVNYSVTRTDNISICTGSSHRVGTSVYTTSGTYTDYFNTIPGCDSIIITNLTVNPVVTGTANYNFCTGDSVMVLGNWYYAATVVNDTLVGGSATGCDSITIHNITTRTVSPALNLGADVVACLDGGVTVFASTAYDTYNWSSGGTTNVLSNTGAASGLGTTNHVLTVTQASTGCTATDDINITYNSCVGLSEVDADLNVNLYPNPATNFVTVEIYDKFNEGNLKLEILNSIGQVVTSRSIVNSSEKVIMDVNNFSKGMYLVRISSDKLYMTKKLIIQK